MKLLVDRNDTVEIAVFCWDKNGIEASHLKSEVPEDVEVVEIVEFSFRKPNYADSNDIMRNSNFRLDSEEGTKFDAMSFQDHMLRSLLIDWSLKDEDGEKITLNQKALSSLAPAVARAAISGISSKINF